MRNLVELLEQIERKIAGDVMDEIACRLSKQLPKLIVNWKEPLMVTSNVQRLQYSVCHLILNSCQPPKSREDIERYQNLSGLIGDFVVSTMIQSMNPIRLCRLKNVKPLKAVEENQDLLKIAQNLMRKIAKLEIKVSKPPQEFGVRMSQKVSAFGEEVAPGKENLDD